MTPWNSLATSYFKIYQRVRLAWDTFSHNETATWGNAETTSSTQPWTTSGGSAADFSISAGLGNISLSTLVSRYASAGSGLGDVDVTVTVTIPVVATGDLISAYLMARFVDTSNYYNLRAAFDTTGNVELTLNRVAAGSSTTLGTAANEVAYAAGTSVNLRLQAIDTSLGAALKGKIWLTTDDEPDDWTLDDIVDNSSALLLGGVGVRAFPSASVSNTLPVLMTFEDFSAFSPAQWNDVTTYVSIAQGLGADVEGFTGRQTELADIEPSRLTLAMKNQSGWFTPDNVVSPYWPDWGTGVPIRWTETIGARTFQPVPDMWVEVPEVTLSFEASGDSTQSDRTLYISAVDLLTRLNRAPAFVSNLGAFIIGEATEGTLRAYWPLTDNSGATYASAAGPVNQDPLRFEAAGPQSGTAFLDAFLTFGAEPGPPGDDSTGLFATENNIGFTFGGLSTSTVAQVAPVDGEFLTILAWVYTAPLVVSGGQFLLARNLNDTGVIPTLTLLADTAWSMNVSTVGGSTSVTGPDVVASRWHLAGGQIDLTTGDCSLWVDRSVATGTTSSVGTPGDPVERLRIDPHATDVIAHIQVYVGASTAFTHADFLAQYEIGMNGFAQQTVDQRIRMICNYAGVADGQLQLEESDSLIQAPAFAGQIPGALASNAAATGGGILFTEGSHLVYHDRKHRFDL